MKKKQKLDYMEDIYEQLIYLNEKANRLLKFLYYAIIVEFLIAVLIGFFLLFKVG